MNEQACLLLDHSETPLGPLAIVADEQHRLRAVGWLDGRSASELASNAHPGGRAVSLRAAADPGGLTSAIRAYFAGDRAAIDALPTVFRGTAFQCAVWRALQDIPSGETRSYRDIAVKIGNPAAVRAVGAAIGANPIGVVVPCHRVIGSSGSLTGYAGGIERKRWLLAHERRAFDARHDDVRPTLGG
jgi:methylated-DNA-[protein]-cysteine S-methyltransferase